MKPIFSKRALVGLVVTLLAFGASACDNRSAGEARVTVIGSQPKLRDPALGPLGEADSVLLENVARGLVTFDSGGNIVGALAERWNVSDDGLSYIFRLTSAEWGDGRKVTAEQVARALRKTIAASGKNRLHDALGAVAEVVAMTDRVIEIRLSAPRPNLLSLLAQPDFAIVRNGYGSGPFKLESKRAADGALVLTRSILAGEDEDERSERIALRGDGAGPAIAEFAAGNADLVLGGRFADLPLTGQAKLSRNALRFDPAAGLFGLVPARASGIAGKPQVRALLSRAIDRDALIAALAVPGLTGRATILSAGLDGNSAPPPPVWLSTPVAERRAAAAREIQRTSADTANPPIAVYLPQGPGGDLLLDRLRLDWGALGFKVERAGSRKAADFLLIDEVAPSGSPAWFVRHFRCDAAAVCDPDADRLLDAARLAQVPGQRYALIGQAAALADSKTVFIALAAPIRWSLVADALGGFKGNRYARHTLSGLHEDATGGREQ